MTGNTYKGFRVLQTFSVQLTRELELPVGSGIFPELLVQLRELIVRLRSLRFLFNRNFKLMYSFLAALQLCKHPRIYDAHAEVLGIIVKRRNQ